MGQFDFETQPAAQGSARHQRQSPHWASLAIIASLLLAAFAGGYLLMSRPSATTRRTHYEQRKFIDEWDSIGRQIDEFKRNPPRDFEGEIEVMDLHNRRRAMEKIREERWPLTNPEKFRKLPPTTDRAYYAD